MPESIAGVPIGVVLRILGLIVLVIVAIGIKKWLFSGGLVNDDFAKLQKLKSRGYERAKKSSDEKIKKFAGKNEIVLPLVHNLGLQLDKVDSRSAPSGISYEEAFEIISAIRRAGKKAKVKILLHTLGGSSLPTIMIADAIRQQEGEVTIYVPYIAMSGGTVLALAADRVVMGRAARLGPVDTIYSTFPYYVGFPLNELEELVIEKGGVANLPESLAMMLFSARKYEEYWIGELKKVTHVEDKSKGDSDKEMSAAAVDLSSGKRPHGGGIDAKEAKGIGMNISTSMPRLAYEIVDAMAHMIKVGKFSDDKDRPPKGEEKGGELLTGLFETQNFDHGGNIPNTNIPATRVSSLT